ncbi:MAG: ATP-binding cassette domain-containing protein, partial [Haloechinothrix sp.]
MVGPTHSTTEELLRIEDLRVSFPRADGEMSMAVRGVSLSLRQGEVLALVGESGSGKSVTARSALRLLDAPTQVHAAKLEFEGTSV